MNLPLYQVDAFTDRVFAGNPAAVCPLDAWLDDDLLQRIAVENNLSETAFFVRSNGGYVFNRDAEGNLVPGDVGLANEGAIAGAQMIKDLQYEYGLIPPGTDSSVAEGLFNEGAAAMITEKAGAAAGRDMAGGTGQLACLALC